MQSSAEFRTKDFYTSCVVLAMGCKFNRLERQQGDIAEFVFAEPPEKCLEIISRHWTGELKVSSKALVEAVKQLKTRLHERF